MKKLDAVKVYEGVAFRGRLNLNCNYALASIKNCAEASLLDPVAENIVGKFLYFYAENPKIENPITCKVGRKFAGIHPGQGRALAAFFRKDPDIDSIFTLLGERPEEETLIIKEITTEYTKAKSLLFSYGKNISTFNFKEYHDPNSKKTLRYMDSIKRAIHKHLSERLFPIQWNFDYTNSINLLGTAQDIEPKTVIHCDNAMGFYKSILYLIDSKNQLSNEFKLVKY